MIDLAGNWKMRAEYLDVTAERAMEVAARDEGAFELIVKDDTKRRMPSRIGFLTTKVPCDVIQPLVEHGLMQEPLMKAYSDDCMWIGSLSWWFVRYFVLPLEVYDQEQVRLFIEMLDCNADIIINGRHVKNHRNAFRALDIDVKDYVHPGDNQIIIRLTTGYELFHPQDSLTFYNNSQYGQRVYLRKPQFTHGWDWCKPVPTCGIGGTIGLNGVSGAVVEAMQCRTSALEENRANMEITLEIDNLSVCTADDAIVRGEISYAGKTVHMWEEELYLAGGLSFVTHAFEIKNPLIWWPNGSGEQPLYDVKVSVTCRGVENVMPHKRIGIRTIGLNMDKLQDGTRRFDVMVNGRKIFMKGGNWVPADSLYLRVTRDKYEALVNEASALGSNMLRIWGGGLYEPDCFYDACSEKGILVMQDFMYACGFYPDHLDWFMHEAALEAEYQTKRLSHQACLAIWTGNNEIHESLTDWYTDKGMEPKHLQGAKIFNYLLPDIVRKNTPGVPYMPSSPFYGCKANDILAGDCHIWSWTRDTKPTGFAYFYELEAMDRIADKVRFSSEYGFYGALKKSSVERFHGGESVSRDGLIWKHHGEQAGKQRMIDPSLRNHVVDPVGLQVDSYLLYTGLIQGMLYEELALALRRQNHCSGNLIWMYNDCWPETGWSVIDYYLTRKNSFYFLKRAYAPQKMILRATAGGASLVLANDSGTSMSGSLKYGYMDFLGNKADTGVLEANVPAFGWQEHSLPLEGYDLSSGFYYVLDAAGMFATSLRAYYRRFKFPPAKVEIVSTRQVGDNTAIVLRTDAFAPVVAVETEDDRVHMSDNYFPMLPGILKEVEIVGRPDNVHTYAVAFQYQEAKEIV